MDGIGQDVNVMVNNEYREIYRELLDMVLDQKSNALDSGNSPFQYMLANWKIKNDFRFPKILDLAGMNPKKLSERNMIGQNLYEIAYSNVDSYTSCLLLRSLLTLKKMNEADLRTSEGGTLLDNALER